MTNREKIIKFLNFGWTHAKIAESLGIHPVHVGHEIAAIRETWLKEKETYHEALNRELADINRQIEQLWEQWELSKLPKVERSVERITNHREVRGDGPAQIEKVTEKNREGLGDMAIMNQITRLRDQRLRLQGLLVGSQTEITVNNNGSGDTNFRVSRATALALSAAVEANKLKAGQSGDNRPASETVIDQESGGGE